MFNTEKNTPTFVGKKQAFEACNYQLTQATGKEVGDE